ncbi:hypothetical protein X551_02048 [Methylibium sp. T29]|nr:hypothetical protein X551_02048 [Methylibium sp. T29]EWS59603.1 hypothetical protein Y694_02588 [Methylibium sp. T29-B]
MDIEELQTFVAVADAGGCRRQPGGSVWPNRSSVAALPGSKQNSGCNC